MLHRLLYIDYCVHPDVQCEPLLRLAIPLQTLAQTTLPLPDAVSIACH